MASRRAVERSVRALSMKEADIAQLADKLFRAKRRVYRRSLHEIAKRLGYDITRPQLSQEVVNGLQSEARDHAERIATNYNADLTRQSEELSDARDEDVRAKLRTWAVARQRKRARPTAITEAYSAHADATMSAFLDLGLPEDVAFDFGGHPELGDAEPVCAICKALILGNPWTLADVVRIGNPHVACRQQWHLQQIEQRDLPPLAPALGQTLAGIVGNDTLMAREGGREQAVSFIVDLNGE